MDGARRLRILRSDRAAAARTRGSSRPALFTFISAWNEFFFALVLIQDPAKKTLPLTLASFVGAGGSGAARPSSPPASLLATIPSLLFFAIIQRRLTSGLLSGAVKG